MNKPDYSMMPFSYSIAMTKSRKIDELGLSIMSFSYSIAI